MAYINITKGWPNLYAVDLAVPVHADHTDIVEGMVLYEDSGKWKKGCAKGRIPFITGPEQFPNALDVKRIQSSTFDNLGFSSPTASNGVVEMGRGNMGGISLTNAIEFQTDQFVSLVGGEVVYSPTTTANAGKLVQATTSDHQILGYCRSVGVDENGRTVATVIAQPTLALP